MVQVQMQIDHKVGEQKEAGTVVLRVLSDETTTEKEQALGKEFAQVLKAIFTSAVEAMPEGNVTEVEADGVDSVASRVEAIIESKTAG